MRTLMRFFWTHKGGFDLLKRHQWLSATVFVWVTLLSMVCLSKGYGADKGLTGNEETSVTQEPEGVPRIQFDEVLHDMGKAFQHQTLEHFFSFKNTGTGTLRIIRVKAG